MANIQRLSKGVESYRITVSLGYDLNGKQIRKTMTWRPESGMTSRQIEKELYKQANDFEERCRNGTLLNDNIKFHEFAEKWMEDHARRTLRTKTYDRYKAMLPRINLSIGNVKLCDLRTLHLHNFYKALSEAEARQDITYRCTIDFKAMLKEKGHTKASFTAESGVSMSVLNSITQGKNVMLGSAERVSKALKMPIKKIFEPVGESKGLSGKTILHHHRLISSILTTAVQWEVLSSNPCDRVKPPKAEKSKQIILQPDEAARMLELLEAEPIQYKTMLIVLLFTGLRRGELLGLEWQDINFSRREITVERSSLYSKDKGIFTDTTKTESSKRTLETSDTVFALLSKYKAWQTEQRLMMGDKWHNSNRLFTTMDGKPIHPDILTSWFSSFVKKNNLPNVHIHSLRHTHASFLIAEGVPITTVAKKLGHNNSYTTMLTYAHEVEDRERIVAKTMDNILPLKEKGAI